MPARTVAPLLPVAMLTSVVAPVEKVVMEASECDGERLSWEMSEIANVRVSAT
jgi:hypothetical protein